MLKAEGYWTGRPPQCAPDPAYPDGMPVNMTRGGEKACSIDLVHPAPSTGYWLVTCDLCNLSILVTAAGRPDDPSVLTVPCKALPA